MCDIIACKVSKYRTFIERITWDTPNVIVGIGTTDTVDVFYQGMKFMRCYNFYQLIDLDLCAFDSDFFFIFLCYVLFMCTLCTISS